MNKTETIEHLEAALLREYEKLKKEWNESEDEDSFYLQPRAWWEVTLPYFLTIPERKMFWCDLSDDDRTALVKSLELT